ncbi:MAG: LysR substrate-binding domain-containing protein [Ignavibacteriaceae bacterium]
MTITQLEYITTVYNYKSFSVAANHCFVTQPTLSMQIQKLEDELGVVIFDRSRNPIKATDIGEQLIRQAKIILEERDRFQNILENAKGKFSGILRIGIIPTIAPFLLPLFVQSFLDKYPKVELIFDELTTGEIVANIHKSTLDLGILAFPVVDSGIVEDSLYFEPFVGFIPEKHKLFSKKKLNVDDLNVDDLLLLKEGHCLREQALKVCKTSEKEWRDDHNKILFEFGSLDTLINLVQQNFGITLLPYLSVRYMNDDSQLKLVREFNPPVPQREIGLVYSKSFIKKHLINAIKKEILSSIPKELKDKKEGLIIH